MTDSLLGQMTWPDAERAATTLLVPLGSTEQHGPHLPLDTDTRIAVAWCERAADRSGSLTVAPPVAYGSSGEHSDFAGTLSIGTPVLTQLLVELGRSAVPPFERVVFVNGHGGNHAAVTEAATVLNSEGRICLASWPRLPNADAHAGRTETSIMLAIAPNLVRRDRAESGNTTPISELIDHLRTGGLRPVAPSGVLGDPTGATAEEGDRLLALLVEQLLAEVG